jgi:hypothetical protein
MPTLSIEFHALPNELVPLVAQCVTELRIHVFGIQFPPWTVSEIATEDLGRSLLDDRFMQYVFYDGKPSLPTRSQTEFYAKHPASLTLNIGRETADSLKGSWLACGTAGEPINPKWKKIASKLRSITEAGTTAINSETGASAYYTNHRYTPEAKALSDAGVRILPFAGGAILKLGKRNAR